MSLLEALRNLDTPVEDGLEELAGEIVAKRLGLSSTVAAQIARYQDQVRRGEPVSVDEAVSVFRLAGRRPDAALVFADAGRRAARYAGRSAPVLARAATRLVPGGLGRSLGAGAAQRAARKVLGLELTVGESGAMAEIAKPLSILALPEGEACAFYASALAELLRLLTGFEGAMVHEQCRGKGDDSCRWRATAVGGYD
ncbi:MAG: hypothetical protein IPI38_06700 [Gemmatimonadetes bacterium]|nr:hypothetical protein [Gemmatimonadota bacterium]MBP6668851.1 hypothetical protein [Gemmatimonadales bacterium]MBK6780376.1 hypothetical protein [Gemmatimonadota bacterium]MBK7351119.1 hypothetical protein [Gemmatimonadota bacterium]MBK7715096.1 hypothetical protein [Gemmatimonadota bacterium]